jgi:hypothetical protein
MKWIVKLILTFVLAISLVFLFKFNETTLILVMADKRIDISLNLIIVLTFIVIIFLIYSTKMFYRIKYLNESNEIKK